MCCGCTSGAVCWKVHWSERLFAVHVLVQCRSLLRSPFYSDSARRQEVLSPLSVFLSHLIDTAYSLPCSRFHRSASEWQHAPFGHSMPCRIGYFGIVHRSSSEACAWHGMLSPCVFMWLGSYFVPGSIADMMNLSSIQIAAGAVALAAQ